MPHLISVWSPVVDNVPGANFRPEERVLAERINLLSGQTTEFKGAGN